MPYTIQEVKKALLCCARVLEEKKERLTEIDSRIGDGDLGSSMQKGMQALSLSVQNSQGDNIARMLMDGGIALNTAAPSTMGTLLSAALLDLAKVWKGKTELTAEDLAAVPRILAESISRKGNAKRGDKTILDALFPYAEAFEAEFVRSGSLPYAAAAGAHAAWEGVEQTRSMQARAGRARWLGEKSRATEDGGAVLCALLGEGLLDLAEDGSLERIPSKAAL